MESKVKTEERLVSRKAALRQACGRQIKHHLPQAVSNPAPSNPGLNLNPLCILHSYLRPKSLVGGWKAALILQMRTSDKLHVKKCL